MTLALIIENGLDILEILLYPIAALFWALNAASKRLLPWSVEHQIPYLKFIYSEKVTKFCEIFPLLLSVCTHSSMVLYLAQLMCAKNCSTTFYCIFQLVWVPMTTGAKETHSDILRGGHRNSCQLENAIKSGRTVFCIYHLG